jgi:uncharacterized membrane protein YphA (DoxX/SURF4 family)
MNINMWMKWAALAFRMGFGALLISDGYLKTRLNIVKLIPVKYEPGILHPFGYWVAHVVFAAAPEAFSGLLAFIECALGLGVMLGIFSNITCILGMLWMFGVWMMGEAFGIPYNHPAPGNAVTYMFVFFFLLIARPGRFWSLDAAFIMPHLPLRWKKVASGSLVPAFAFKDEKEEYVETRSGADKG